MATALSRSAIPAGLCAAVLALTLIGCQPHPPDRLQVVATIPPVAFILQELASPRAEVVTLLHAGTSPHTYEVTPADARAAESALALFYVDDTLDGWAARLPAREKKLLFELVPPEARLNFEGTEAEHEGHVHTEGDFDPHFWSDPTVVKAILPQLAGQLAELDPEGAETYHANAARFAGELDEIDRRTRETLEPIKGQAVVTFHPSWDYFLHRYGIRSVGVLEPSPGKEASPKEIMALVESIHASGAKAVFSEPQLPSRPAEVLAETAGVKLGLLDPNGGVPGRATYRELIEFNTRALKEMLQ